TAGLPPFHLPTNALPPTSPLKLPPTGGGGAGRAIDGHVGAPGGRAARASPPPTRLPSARCAGCCVGWGGVARASLPHGARVGCELPPPLAPRGGRYSSAHANKLPPQLGSRSGRLSGALANKLPHPLGGRHRRPSELPPARCLRGAPGGAGSLPRRRRRRRRRRCAAGGVRRGCARAGARAAPQGEGVCCRASHGGFVRGARGGHVRGCGSRGG
ncbi:hypothetical protein T484DRAFT_1918406, partial [Baffinella frigidus]